MLDIAQSVASQVLRIFKLQKKESFSVKLDQLKDQAWPIENAENNFCKILNSAQARENV